MATAPLIAANMTVLYGENPNEPFCSLLEIDGFKILLDCGWDERLDVKMLEPLAEVAPSVDIVLLTFPDIAHIGALPYARAKLGLRCPAFCTVPVWRMGKLFVEDMLWGCEQFERCVFDRGDIEETFHWITPLKYQQEKDFEIGGTTLTIAPYAAGRIVGGAFWLLKRAAETLIYAVEFNHRREQHLNGFVLEVVERPSVLITDGYNMLRESKTRRATLDQHLFSAIKRTLTKGGDVLIPVDPAGRVLELLLCLHRFWKSSKMKFPLIFVSRVSRVAMDFARSQMEYMSNACRTAALSSSDRDRPFHFHPRDVHLLHDLRALDQFRGPKLILASDAYISVGYSLQIFRHLSQNPKNLVIITQRGPEYTASYQLSRSPVPKEIKIKARRSIEVDENGVPLDPELKKLVEEKKSKIAEEDKREEKKDETSQGPDVKKEELTEGNDTDIKKVMVEDVKDAKVGEKRDGNADTAPKKRKRKKRKKTLKTKYPMFQEIRETREFDDYGEVIDPEDFQAPEEQSEPGPRSRNGRQGAFPRNRSGEQPFVQGKNGMYENGPRSRNGQRMDRGRGMDHKNGRGMPRGPGFEPPGPRPRLKTIWSILKIDVKCEVMYLDYEGRSDSKAIKTILKQIKPSKIVTMHGSDSSKDAMKKYSQRKFKSTVLVPKKGEPIDIMQEGGAIPVILEQSLLEQLEFKKEKVNGFDIAWADSLLKFKSRDEIDGTASSSNEDAKIEAFLPVLEAAPADKVKGHSAIFLGQLKLPILARQLKKKGEDMPFEKNMMRNNDSTMVLRKLENKIKYYGFLSEKYFKVRNVLYSEFTSL